MVAIYSMYRDRISINDTYHIAEKSVQIEPPPRELAEHGAVLHVKQPKQDPFAKMILLVPTTYGVHSYLRASTNELDAQRARGTLDCFALDRGVVICEHYAENESGHDVSARNCSDS